MAQHFLHSAAARSLSPAKVMRMSDRGAENVFLRLRWPQTDGKPVCPRCGCDICYDCRIRSRAGAVRRAAAIFL
jgi:Transposase zinc-ribbon domain